MSSRDEYAFFAYNSRLDSLQAVVGLSEIKNFRWITNTRIANANILDAALSKLKGKIALPPRAADETPCLPPVSVPRPEPRRACSSSCRSAASRPRSTTRSRCTSSPPAVRLGYKKGDFPMAEADAAATITLPVHQHLTRNEVRFMIEAIGEFYA